MKNFRGSMTRSLQPLVLLTATLSAAAHAQSVNVSTWQYGTERTGQNTSETTLTQANVNKTHFGKICSAQLDGQVFAQPLVVTNVNFNGNGAKTVAYVVTQNDSLYAIDATNCSVLQGGQKQLLQSGEEAATCADIHNAKICPVVGLLGTPVIEITGSTPHTTGTLYAVAESECPGCGQNGANVFYHRLWALDITSLASVNSGPVQICSSGCGKYTTGSDFSQVHYQRPGLLFLNSAVTVTGNNMVYAAFSMIDGGGNDPNGFVWAYNAHNLGNRPLVYETTDGANQKRRGGIWQAGAGLVASTDANGVYHLYFSTGDGDFDLNQQQAPNTDGADSFLKLNTDLGTLSVSPQPYYFTPADAYWRGCVSPFNDKDFGSGGTIAIPAQTFNPAQYYALKMDKENFLWVIDRTSPGGYNGDNSNYQYCGGQESCTNPCQAPNNNVENFQFATSGPDRSTPAFWSGAVSSGDQGELYLAGTYGQLNRFPVSTSCNPSPVCTTSAATTNIDPTGTEMGYSATPTISSNGTNTTTGIVWVIRNNVTSAGILYAFKATDLSELYDSTQCSGDGLGLATTYSVPTVANGYVYVGSQSAASKTNQGYFYIFGPLTRSC